MGKFNTMSRIDRDYSNYPVALREALWLAQDASRLNLRIADVWIEVSFEEGYTAPNVYQVRYLIPYRSEIFICSTPLIVDPDDMKEYLAYEEQN